MVTIDWKLKRLDEGEPARVPGECSIEAIGAIQLEGELIGWVSGFYLVADDLGSSLAFWELWDLDARTCDIFEAIVDRKTERLREPLHLWLEEVPGILCLESMLLLPAHRGQGLGLEVIRETLCTCADMRVGAVLLKSDPLQYESSEGEEWERGGAPDPGFDQLPRDDQKRDREKLQFHFRSWGMQRLPRTNYMVALPDTLVPEVALKWPPCTIQDYSNTCVVCDRLIDFKREPWERSRDGLVHKSCNVPADGGPE